MVPKFTQASRTTLQVGITAAESTSIVLKKLVDIYGNALAFTDFTTKVYLTIEPGSDNEEIISCAGFTVNSDGTVALDTTIVRGLAAKSPYGATGTARSHSAGVTVIISNNPQFYDAIMDFVVNLEDAQTIAGKKTFSTVPDTSAAPVAGNDLANKTYVDAAGIGAATSVQVVVTGKAGEVIADGDLIYFDTITNNEWMLCDADIAATVENVQLGIAQGAGTNGVDIVNGILLRGIDDAQTGLIAGEIMYAGNTPGAIQNTPGTTEVTVGIVPAGETTKIYFSPRFNQMLTENQQDLIAQIESGTDWYAASSVGTDAYAMTIVPAITAYTTGMKFRFKADVANTGACTLAVSGLAALAIKKLNDQDTTTGDIEAGQIVEVVYDGSDFQMQSQVASISLLRMDVITATGTWTRPAGVTQVKLRVVGGGGGGGNVGSTSGNGAGGGGGAGGYAEAVVAVSGNVTVTIGAGGAASGNGGNSIFSGDTVITANGGTGGVDDGGADGGAGGGPGGTTINADLGITGQAGSKALANGVTYDGSVGGSNPLGQGGLSNGSHSTIGVAGTGFGAGGSGSSDTAVTSRNGGVGTAGVVIVEYI